MCVCVLKGYSNPSYLFVQLICMVIQIARLTQDYNKKHKLIKLKKNKIKM